MAPQSQRHARRSGNPDPDPGNPDFPEIFFSLFSLLWTSWDLRVTPRMDRNHLIRIRTGKSGFFESPFFFVFRLFKLKPLQYWRLWTPDSSLPFQIEHFMSCFSTIINILCLNVIQMLFLNVLLNFHFIQFFWLVSVHSIYNVPLEPERAPKGRRAEGP